MKKRAAEQAERPVNKGYCALEKILAHRRNGCSIEPPQVALDELLAECDQLTGEWSNGVVECWYH